MTPYHLTGRRSAQSRRSLLMYTLCPRFSYPNPYRGIDLWSSEGASVTQHLRAGRPTWACAAALRSEDNRLGEVRALQAPHPYRRRTRSLEVARQDDSPEVSRLRLLRCRVRPASPDRRLRELQGRHHRGPYLVVVDRGVPLRCRDHASPWSTQSRSVYTLSMDSHGARILSSPSTWRRAAASV